jgi:hypothetical protein
MMLGVGATSSLCTGMKPVNLAEKLSTFTEYWQPRTVAEFNGHDLMVVPVAEEESHILLIEPSGTPNAGNAETAAPRSVV